MSEREFEKSKRLLRFFHPEKRFSFLAGAEDHSALAAMFGMSLSSYQQERKTYRDNVEVAVRQLLDEEIYNRALTRVVLADGARIAVIGDSLTDDYQSWFEMLTRSLQLLHPNKNLSFYNTALSGDTSAQLLGSIVKISAIKPHLLLSFIGTNDARVQGQGCKHCVELDEFERNIASLQTYGERHSERMVWITPSGVDEDRIAKDWLLSSFEATWSNKRIDEIADVLLAKIPSSIDIRPVFNTGDRSELFSEDGLHWSLEGQIQVARKVVTQLADIIEGVKQ